MAHASHMGRRRGLLSIGMIWVVSLLTQTALFSLPPTRQELAELAYPKILPRQEVQLRNGRWEDLTYSQSPMMLELESGEPFAHDFDRDGQLEAVAVLAMKRERVVDRHLAVVGRRDGQPTVRAVFALPPRSRPVEFRSESGDLIVELETIPLYDWLPTERDTQRYLLSNGEIRQLASWKDFGENFWWVEAIDQVSYFGSAVPWTLGAGLDFLAGSAGCNEFRLPASFLDGRLRVVGPPELLGKPRSCLDSILQLERYYLELLQGAERLERVEGGSLELVTRLAGQERRLRFTPKRWKSSELAPNPVQRQKPPGLGSPP